jgi:Flp pilus assembly pilin Flp
MLQLETSTGLVMIAYAKQKLLDLRHDTSGAVAVEYAFIAVAIFVALLPGIGYVSSAVSQLFIKVSDYFLG